jgi:hypothetical protein
MPDVTGGAIGGSGSLGLPMGVGAGMTVEPGTKSGNLAPRAVTLALKENTATAQSAIAQLEICDLFFMARTVMHSGSDDNATRVTPLLLALPGRWPAPFFLSDWIGLTSGFTRENGMFSSIAR